MDGARDWWNRPRVSFGHLPALPAVVGVSLAELDTTNLIQLIGDKGLLEPTFARRIRGMARMRNAILHTYLRLDYEAIHRAVTEQLDDFDEFARQVRACLRRGE